MNRHRTQGKWMMLCCIIPFVLLLVLLRLGLNLGPFTRILPYAALLICPLIHIGMMVFLFRGRGSCCGNEGQLQGKK